MWTGNDSNSVCFNNLSRSKLEKLRIRVVSMVTFLHFNGVFFTAVIAILFIVSCQSSSRYHDGLYAALNNAF